MSGDSQLKLVVLTGDTSKEKKMLEYVFGRNMRGEGFFNRSYAMCLWHQWSSESKNVVMRCIARGWVKMEWSCPTENGFQLWLLCHRNFLKDYELSDEKMMEVYHREYCSIPTLTLTSQGKEILQQ